MIIYIYTVYIRTWCAPFLLVYVYVLPVAVRLVGWTLSFSPLRYCPEQYAGPFQRIPPPFGRLPAWQQQHPSLPAGEALLLHLLLPNFNEMPKESLPLPNSTVARPGWRCCPSAGWSWHRCFWAPLFYAWPDIKALGRASVSASMCSLPDMTYCISKHAPCSKDGRCNSSLWNSYRIQKLYTYIHIDCGWVEKWFTQKGVQPSSCHVQRFPSSSSSCGLFSCFWPPDMWTSHQQFVFVLLVPKSTWHGYKYIYIYVYIYTLWFLFWRSKFTQFTFFLYTLRWHTRRLLGDLSSRICLWHLGLLQESGHWSEIVPNCSWKPQVLTNVQLYIYIYNYI